VITEPVRETGITAQSKAKCHRCDQWVYLSIASGTQITLRCMVNCPTPGIETDVFMQRHTWRPYVRQVRRRNPASIMQRFGRR